MRFRRPRSAGSPARDRRRLLISCANRPQPLSTGYTNSPIGSRPMGSMVRNCPGYCGKSSTRMPIRMMSCQMRRFSIFSSIPGNRWRETVYARKIPHRLFVSPAMQFLFSENAAASFRFTPVPSLRPADRTDQAGDRLYAALDRRPAGTRRHDAKSAAHFTGRADLCRPGAGRRNFWPKPGRATNSRKLALMQAQKGRVPVFILGPQELRVRRIANDRAERQIPAAGLRRVGHHGHFGRADAGRSAVCWTSPSPTIAGSAICWPPPIVP